MDDKQQKTQLKLPLGPGDGGEASRIEPRGTELSRAEGEPQSPAGTRNLIEEMLEPANWQEAVKRVIQNKGAAGVDGMTVGRLPRYLERHGEEVHRQLLEGRYQPQPLRTVQLPKPTGGTRLLGISTVLDRCVEQALLQVLQKRWDPTFSEHSYGFRPGRSAHQAIAQAQLYIEEGYNVVVDFDLEKFFDRVNHDRLMGEVAKRVEDKRVLKLIRAFLNAGRLRDGLLEATEEGVPQGSPISPLLSNLVLDELDRELQKRGLRFVRYADDCNVYVRSERAAQRVMHSLKDFISRRLKLKVNDSKSAVDKPSNRKFLGFSFTPGKRPKRRIAQPALDKFKHHLRCLTRRRRGVSFPNVIKDLKEYMQGWIGYFGFTQTYSYLKTLDGWVRRRLRSFLWKQWKTGRKRYAELRKRGVTHTPAKDAAGSSRGPWRLSAIQAVQMALPNSFFALAGLPSLESAARAQAAEPPSYT
jgi:RNA-directed DNA polymerase